MATPQGPPRRQPLGDPRAQAVRQGQGARTHVTWEEERAAWRHRPPHPGRGAGQALERLSRGALAVFAGAEEGDPCGPLPLRNVDLAQELTGEGLQGRGGLAQPAQHGVGLDLADPGPSTKAPPCGESREGPAHLGGSTLCGGKRRARRLQKVPGAAATPQGAPAASIGGTVGADIAAAHPAVLRTGRLRAKGAAGLALATTPAGEEPARGRRPGGLRTGCHAWRTALARRLMHQPCKRLAVARRSGRFHRRGDRLAAGPKPMGQEHQPGAKNPGGKGASQGGGQHQPLSSAGVHGLSIP